MSSSLPPESDRSGCRLLLSIRIMGHEGGSGLPPEMSEDTSVAFQNKLAFLSRAGSSVSAGGGGKREAGLASWQACLSPPPPVSYIHSVCVCVSVAFIKRRCFNSAQCQHSPHDTLYCILEELLVLVLVFPLQEVWGHSHSVGAYLHSRNCA